MNSIYRIFGKFLKAPLAVVGVVFLGTAAIPAHAGIWEDFSAGMASMLLAVGSAFTYVGGTVFNFSIKYGIVEFAQFGNASGVLVGWTVLRDVSNIALIFIFLAVGIATILGVQKYGARNLLPKLIIVALLINFSLFATKFAIDTSHVLAASILNATGIQAECSTETTTTSTGVEQVGENCDINRGLALQFLYHFNIQSIYDLDAENFQEDLQGSNLILFGFLGFIFLVVVGIGFISAGIMLLFRMGMLLILMIGSAVAFTAIILPNTEKYWNQWFTRLTKEVFVAPAMILMFAITLLFLDSVAAIMLPNGERPTFIQAIGTGEVEKVSIIVMFIITLILFLLSLKIAQDFGGFGGKMANNFYQRATGRVAGASLGGVGALSRTTIGRAGQWYASDEARQEKIAARKGIVGLASRGLLRTASAASKASYDPRALKMVNAGAQRAGIGSLGKPQKGGRVGHVKAVTKRKEKDAEVFTSDKAKLKYAEVLKNPGDIGSAWESVRGARAGTKKAGENVESRAAKKVKQAELKKIDDKFAEDIKNATEQVKKFGDEMARVQEQIKKQAAAGGNTDALRNDFAALKTTKERFERERSELEKERKYQREELKDLNAYFEKEEKKKEDDKKSSSDNDKKAA